MSANFGLAVAMLDRVTQVSTKVWAGVIVPPKTPNSILSNVMIDQS